MMARMTIEIEYDPTTGKIYRFDGKKIYIQRGFRHGFFINLNDDSAIKVEGPYSPSHYHDDNGRADIDFIYGR